MMSIKALLRTLAIALFVMGIAIPEVSGRDSYSKGEKSFGPKVGFVTRNTSAIAGLVFTYNFSRHVRIAPEASMVFRHKNLDAIIFDLDFHFPMPFSQDRMAMYPLVGLNISSWSRHSGEEIENKDVTTHLNRIGGNLGIGYEIKCKPTLKLNIEAKYTLIQTFPGAQICAGISYLF